VAGISRLAPEKPSAYEDEPSARMPTVTKKPAGALLGGIVIGSVAASSYFVNSSVVASSGLWMGQREVIGATIKAIPGSIAYNVAGSEVFYPVIR